MNISGISGAGAIQPYGGQKANNADTSQLEAKLAMARKDKTKLEKSLSSEGGDEDQIKAELAKKEQEIRDLEKQIQNEKSNGKDVKANDTQQTGASENISAPRDKSKLVSDSVIDEYV